MPEEMRLDVAALLRCGGRKYRVVELADVEMMSTSLGPSPAGLKAFAEVLKPSLRARCRHFLPVQAKISASERTRWLSSSLRLHLTIWGLCSGK